jgi:transposase
MPGEQIAGISKHLLFGGSHLAKFKPSKEDTIFLLPPSLDEFIGENHLARTVSAVVNQLDTSMIEKKYSEIGQNTYHPRILLKLLFYGYAAGVRSGRKIADRCKTDTAFMYLAQMYQPDFRTINDFRKNNLQEIEDYFVDIVRICKEIGMLKLGLIAIDGSKVKANAAARRTKDREGYEKWAKNIRKSMREKLAEGVDLDEEEDLLYGKDMTGDELPEELRKKGVLLKKIKEAAHQLEEGEKRNLTDPDARFMKERNGLIRPGYNGQITTDENQNILAAEITAETNDINQLKPMIDKTEENIEDEHGPFLADSGYAGFENYEYLEREGKDALIPDQLYYNSGKDEEADKEKDGYKKKNFTFDPEDNRYICPEGKPLVYWKRDVEVNKRKKRTKLVYRGTECGSCSKITLCTKGKQRIVKRDIKEHLQEDMRQKLDSEEGRKTYQKRMSTVEPVFGNLKYNLGYRQFLLRSKEKASAEFKLMCIGHNLQKIWNFQLAQSRQVG